MSEYIEFETIDLGYYNPETGRDISDITGMRNRPGIDPVSHKYIEYPKAIKDQKDKIIKWHEKKGKLLLELDVLPGEANSVVLDEKVKHKAKRKTKEQVTNEWGIVFEP